MEAQIRDFEESSQVKLPQAYVGFLRGDFGDFSDALRENVTWASDHETLQELTVQAKELLAKNHHPFTLAANEFVFGHEENRFLYFRCERDNEDPAVFSFTQGDSGPKLQFAHFSDWVESLRGNGQMGENPGTIPSTREPASVAAHLDLAELITPELHAELKRVEVRFPAELQRVEETLGWPLGAFRPATANLIAGMIFGVVFLAFGSAVLAFGIHEAVSIHFQMPLAAQSGMSWVIFVIMSLLSGGMAAGGVCLVRWAKRLLGSRLVVAAHGLSWVRPDEIETVAWSDIRAVEEIVLKESLPLNTPIKHVLPKSEGRQLVVHTTEGKKMTFSANTILEIQVFRSILERVAADLQIPRSEFRGEV